MLDDARSTRVTWVIYRDGNRDPGREEEFLESSFFSLRRVSRKREISRKPFGSRSAFRSDATRCVRLSRSAMWKASVVDGCVVVGRVEITLLISLRAVKMSSILSRLAMILKRHPVSVFPFEFYATSSLSFEFVSIRAFSLYLLHSCSPFHSFRFPVIGFL